MGQVTFPRGKPYRFIRLYERVPMPEETAPEVGSQKQDCEELTRRANKQAKSSDRIRLFSAVVNLARLGWEVANKYGPDLAARWLKG